MSRLRAVRFPVSPRSVAFGLAVVGLLVGLGACAPTEMVTPADVALLPLTHKTGADLAMGTIRGKDCSTARYANGGQHCVDATAQPPARTSLYCYRTLGSVTCYDKPSTAKNDVLIGSAGY